MLTKLQEIHHRRQVREWARLRRSLETVEAARSKIDAEVEPEAAAAFDAHHDRLRQRERRLYAKLSDSNEIIVI